MKGIIDSRQARLSARRSKRRLRTFLASFLLFISFVFLTSAAHAGSWQQTITNSGSSTGRNPNTGQTETWAWDSPTSFGISTMQYVSDGTPDTVKAEGTIKIKFTWVPDPNLASDPPPPEVLVNQSATAYWCYWYGNEAAYSGTSSVSIGNSTNVTYINGAGVTAQDRVTRSGGEFEVSCQVKAEANSSGAPYEPYYDP